MQMIFSMHPISIAVSVLWDEEAQVWVATTNDIQGLAVEAATLEQLEAKARVVLNDLIELDGI